MEKQLREANLGSGHRERGVSYQDVAVRNLIPNPHNTSNTSSFAPTQPSQQQLSPTVLSSVEAAVMAVLPLGQDQTASFLGLNFSSLTRAGRKLEL